MPAKDAFILWFDEVDKTETGLVGSRGASLGEMVKAGFGIPSGFVVSTKAYYSFVHENKLTSKINDLLSSVSFDRPDSLMQVSAHIRKLIMEGSMPKDLVKEIFFSYRKLSGIFRDAFVIVHSSPVEQHKLHNFFQKHSQADSDRMKSELIGSNVKGEANLILKIKEGWSSLFDPQAIIYRHEKRLDHFRGGMAIVVQKIIEADRSGLVFTVDPFSNDKTKILIEAIFGKGELLSRGYATPDRYEVRKTDLKIIDKMIANQTILIKRSGQVNKEIKIPHLKGEKQKLTLNQILDLSMLAKRLEKHYYFAQEIEWAIEKNKIFILRTKNVNSTGHIKKEDLKPSEKLPLLLKGAGASRGIVCGPVKIVSNVKELSEINSGDILVAGIIDSYSMQAVKKAGAIITDHGGGNSHGAIVLRNFGKPYVTGTGKATNILRNGMIVTVNGALGEVYKGGVGMQSHFRTATQVYADVGQPLFAQKVAQKNGDGIMPLRAEFLMDNIGIHPKKLFTEEKKEIYVRRLAENIGDFCTAFIPRPVVYRACNFRTSEYRLLDGGDDFETIESNPVIGYRGAYRYIHDPEIFKLEIEAIKMVRNQMGIRNLWMMIPFCRTVKELTEVKRIISLAGLHRSPTFKLWMMAEIPANIILLDKFIEAGIDGVSVGLNSLTTLILGTDPDNSDVAAEFDENDPAVFWALEKTVKICHKHMISSSVCGQAISMYPDLLEKVVELGISSVSVTPDIIEDVREKIFGIERKLIEKRHYGKD